MYQRGKFSNYNAQYAQPNLSDMLNLPSSINGREVLAGSGPDREIRRSQGDDGRQHVLVDQYDPNIPSTGHDGDHPRVRTVFKQIMPDFSYIGQVKGDIEAAIPVIKQQLTWAFYLVILLVVLIVVVLVMQIMMFMKTSRINSQPLY